ncbi:SHOCT domain-containing protein [Knoellia sp. 3-2P3]|uniref:SHOCT domain-containing protein n=1 Tax=unclassified Knoellia TaxID=2618719 RepID=UPI0023DC5CEC|nr:SHOCT domain-containing protein [Knoellia sp. 3-2P3]MDF2093657.1 SHOCT domain-containing protein [Knoellia sp. 3-2P3]
MMWNNGMGWGGWLLMSVTTVAFWAVVVFGIVALFRGTRDGGSRDGGSRSGQRDEDSAQRILEERFARGEIDADEYRQRSQVLHSVH